MYVLINLQMQTNVQNDCVENACKRIGEFFGMDFFVTKHFFFEKKVVAADIINRGYNASLVSIFMHRQYVSAANVLFSATWLRNIFFSDGNSTIRGKNYLPL